MLETHIFDVKERQTRNLHCNCVTCEAFAATPF